MNVDFINIKTYLDNKENNIFMITFVYSIIIGVLLILVVLFSVYTKKVIYYNNFLFIDNNSVYAIVEQSMINSFVENNEIIINDKKYQYIIDEINIDNNNLNYRVKLIINLKENMINGVFVEYKLLVKEEKVLEYFVRMIKGG